MLSKKVKTMGLNTAGNNVGSWAGSPYYSPQSASAGSVGLQTLATGTEALGDIFSGVGGYQQNSYAASVSKQNASAALQAGQNAEIESKLRYGSLEGKQKAEQGASGASVNSPSATSVRTSTEQIGAMDAALIHYNAARQAYGEDTNAALQKRAAGNALSYGLMKTGATLIGGASSLGGKYLQNKLSGASNPMTLPPTPSNISVDGT
jgi:hypothetical protein